MGSQIPDLWPSDLSPATIVTPVAILREQAAKVGARTNDLLEGRVTTRVQGKTRFMHYFSVVAPSLDNYAYQLLEVTHEAEPYPLLAHCTTDQAWRELHSEDEFLAYLREVFSSEETKRVIGALLAQVTS